MPSPSPIPPRPPVLAITLLLALATLPARADERLVAEAPGDVAPTGQWQLVPERSDDPDKLLERVRKQGKKALEGRSFLPGGWNVGVGGPIGGVIDAARNRPGKDDEEAAEAEAKRAKVRELQETYEAALHNPPSLATTRAAAIMIVRTDLESLSCEAGTTKSVTLPGGTAERSCGWSGRTWVLRYTPRPDGPVREERFDYSAAGGELTYTTSIASAEPFSTLKLRRVYRRETAAR